MARPRNQTRSPRNVPGQSPTSRQQQHSLRDEPAPSLVDLIEQQRFDEAIARARKIPSEASVNNSGASGGAHNSIMGQGNLALHEACKNQPPLELIEALLDVNEEAAQTKGQWGYLPLHFACCSRASPEVVAKLIVTYPSATRTKDDHEGFLPLHLAAKWGADDEVIMALLTVHPKASSARDLSGKTPIEHATALSSPHVREAVVNALKRAPILCAVSKAAMHKLAYESDAKLREVVEVYQERMTDVKDKYEQDKSNAVALEVQLRKELWDEKERSAHLSERVVMLERQLEEKEREMEEREQVFEEIQDLIAGKRKPKLQVQAMQEHQEIERREMEERVRQQEEQKLAKHALRQFLSAANSHPSEPSRDDESDHDERREPPPTVQPGRSAPSPKSAAVAQVKEWFSSDTTELAVHHDDRRSTSTVAANRQPSSQRDKIEQYRNISPYHQRQDATGHTSSSKNTLSSMQQSSAQNSLLSRSLSAPRSSALLARHHKQRSASQQQQQQQQQQEYNSHITNTGHHSSRVKSNSSSGMDRQPSSTSSPLHQQQSVSSIAVHQDFGHERSKSGSYSGSSRYTQTQGNSSRYRVQQQKQQHQQKSQSHTSSSSRRPRESYSTVKAQTSAYSHRIMDDANESLTMDSNIDWE